MKKHVGHSVLILILALLVLIILSQATRFENKLKIVYDGQTLSAYAHSTNVSVNVNIDRVYNVTLSSQKSMSGERGLAALNIYGENSEHVFSLERNVIYLFGRDILGNLVTGNHSTFKETFGDWYTNKFYSETTTIYDKPLPDRFTMEAQIIGRGGTTLELSSAQKTVIRFNDGLLAHTLQVCTLQSCKQKTPKETKLTNIKRISNFFIEALLGAVLILIAIFAIEVTFRKHEK